MRRVASKVTNVFETAYPHVWLLILDCYHTALVKAARRPKRTRYICVKCPLTGEKKK